MLELFIALSVAIVILLVILLIKLFTQKEQDISPQMIDLRNQIEDLKTRQLENQTSSLTLQQNLLLKTQTEIREQLGQIMKNLGDSLFSQPGNINTQLKASNEVIEKYRKSSAPRNYNKEYPGYRQGHFLSSGDSAGSQAEGESWRVPS